LAVKRVFEGRLSSMKKVLIFTATMLLLFMVGSAFALETGEIQGKVVDQNGQPLPGVTVTVKSPSLIGERVTTSERDGTFRFPLLPVGTYEVSHEMEGFATTVQKGVIVHLGGVTKITTSMAVRTGEVIEITAEQPLIDVTKAETSYRVTSGELATSPTQARTIQDVVKFTPGVMGVREDTMSGSGSGLPSFRGQGEEGNNYLIDGLTTRGPRVNDPAVTVNYDAIDEVQIISDPFTPDLGQALGGVVNTVTKTGGNQFHGQGGWLFRDKHLQAKMKDQLAITSLPSAFTRHNWYGNVGGPIAKEKAWFFVSDNLYYNTDDSTATQREWLSIPKGHRTTDSNTLLGKVTGAVASNHNVSFRFIYDKFINQSGAIGLPEAASVPDYKTYSLAVNYKGIINPKSWVEINGGYSRNDNNVVPLSGDFGPARYFFEDIVMSTNNYYQDYSEVEKLTDITGKFYRTFNTGSWGNHEVGLGANYYRNFASDARTFTGTAEDPFPGNGFDNGGEYDFLTGTGDPTHPGTPNTFTEYAPYGFSNKTQGVGLYAYDSVTIKNFTIMGGLRTEYQKVYDDTGATVWTWNMGKFLSPRATVTYDITSDQKNVAKFGYAMLTDTATTRILEFFNSHGGYAFRQYVWIGPTDPSIAQLHDPANWDFTIEQSNATAPMVFNPDIHPNRLHNFLGEYDRRINPDWAAKLRFKYSKSDHLLEDLGLYTTETRYHYKFLLDNFELKKRNYKAVEIELDGRVGKKLDITGSYVWSQAKGTNPGQFEFGPWSGTSGSAYDIGVFGDHPNYPADDPYAWVGDLFTGLGGRGIGDEGWYGYLPYDVRHAVKVNASYKAPYEIIVSGAVEIHSGLHWELKGFQDAYGDYLTFPEGRGTRTTPTVGYLDLSAEKGFKVGHGVVLNARVDAFNILNSQRAISFVREEGSIDFGQIWGRQAPRQFRFYFNVNW
jgi:outer membrane receptor for ferrienterochelin and colicin